MPPPRPRVVFLNAEGKCLHKRIFIDEVVKLCFKNSFSPKGILHTGFGILELNEIEPIIGPVKDRAQTASLTCPSTSGEL